MSFVPSISAGQQLLQALDEQQRQVAQQVLGPVCVQAGAGTGKTRAITYRIAYGVTEGVYDPANVLALTFTARAAAEMRSRLSQLGVRGVQARTFHAAALRQLSYFWPVVIGGQVPQILEHKGSLVGNATSRLGLKVDRLAIGDIASEIEWARVSLISAESYAEKAQAMGRIPPADLDYATVSKLLFLYEEVKRERGVIDFEDVLILTAGMIQEREEVAGQIRRQYQYFVVDEYQDVSPLQYHLLNTWVNGRQHLCVVGDGAQTIYSFAGATSSYLNSFTDKYPNATKVKLVKNYRSSPQIISLANQITSPRNRRQGVNLGGVKLIAQRDSGPAPTFTVYPDDQAEAEGVAGQIAALCERGTPVGDIAILYRTNSQSEALERELSKKRVTYQVRGGKQFYARPEIKRALGALQVAASRVVAGQDFMHQVEDTLLSCGWQKEAPVAVGAVRERWEGLQVLWESAEEYGKQGGDLPGFLSKLKEQASVQQAPNQAGVTLSSLHAAKGLEWPVVFIIGMSEGLLPISLAKGIELNEEQRLLYVGVTRAQSSLHLSYALSRHVGGRSGRKVSRFLAGMWPNEKPAPQSVSDRRSKAKDQAAAFVAEQSEEVLARFVALKEWRNAVAQETQKPAYTVFHDATLRDIAQACPRTLNQLGFIRGIGAAKLASYGADVLRILRECDANLPAD